MTGWLSARRTRWFVDIVEERTPAAPAADLPRVVEHVGQVRSGGDVSVRVELRAGVDAATVEDVSWTTQEWLDSLVGRLESVVDLRSGSGAPGIGAADG